MKAKSNAHGVFFGNYTSNYWFLRSDIAATIVLMIVSFFAVCNAVASDKQGAIETSPKAYVYTELQVSIPFRDVPWERLNDSIKKQPGFINKTWLSGVDGSSVGGLYAFDSIAHAQEFVINYFPVEAKSFGVAQITKIFDADATEEASREMNSVFYVKRPIRKPGAFVYTEVQLHAAPFNTAVPWRDLNPTLKKQPGLISKTWLNGINTGTPGGFYAFDSIENARLFVINYFPGEAQKLNAAFSTKLFDAKVTETASRAMNSPFYD